MTDTPIPAVTTSEHVPEFHAFDLEAEQRACVVAVARSWVGTKYHHEARIKGVGCDCATLLCEVYAEAGITAPILLEPYPPQWFLHRSEERYLKIVEQYARRIDGPPGPGDIAVWKVGHCFAHGAIVTEWPRFVHAFQKARVVLEASGMDGAMREHVSGPRKGQPREVRYFTPW